MDSHDVVAKDWISFICWKHFTLECAKLEIDENSRFCNFLKRFFVAWSWNVETKYYQWKDMQRIYAIEECWYFCQ